MCCGFDVSVPGHTATSFLKGRFGPVNCCARVKSEQTRQCCIPCQSSQIIFRYLQAGQEMAVVFSCLCKLHLVSEMGFLRRNGCLFSDTYHHLPDLFVHAKQQPLQGRPHRARYDFFEGLASLAVYDLIAGVLHMLLHAEVSQPNHDISILYIIYIYLTYSERF